MNRAKKTTNIVNKKNEKYTTKNGREERIRGIDVTDVRAVVQSRRGVVRHGANQIARTT